MIYTPEEPTLKPLQPTVGVKFSNRIFAGQSFLKKHNVQYTEEDLIDTPLGRCYEIERESSNQ